MMKRAMKCLGWTAAAFTSLVLAISRGHADAIPPSFGQDPASNTPGLLWYGGDFFRDSYESNNSTSADGGGSGVLESFVVNDPAGWHVTGLFSNEVKEYAPAPGPSMPAFWSIRTGAGPGDFGQVLYSGVSDASVAPTGRPQEYQVAVSGLSLDLKPGVYYMQVSPILGPSNFGDYYVGHSLGTNAIGLPGPQPVLIYWRGWLYGRPDENIEASGLPELSASMGVIGVGNTPGFRNVPGPTHVPEPSSLLVFGVIIVGAGWARRTRARSA